MSKILRERELNAIDRRIEEIAVTVAQCSPGRDGDVLANLEDELQVLISKLDDSIFEMERYVVMEKKPIMENVVVPPQFRIDAYDAVNRAMDNLIETYGKEFVLAILEVDHDLVPAEITRYDRKQA